MLPFNKLNFGLASAESERAEYPKLIEAGYWDCRGALEAALNGREFLFLGYKGAGKSLLGEKLGLLGNHSLLITLSRLSDFPFKTFKSIVAGTAEPQAKYPLAWSWLLLLKLLDSFLKDEGAPSAQDPDLLKAASELRRLGLLPNASLSQLVHTSTKNTFKAQIPELVAFLSEETLTGYDLQFAHLVAHLRRLVGHFRSTARHLLVIDGLDDVLTGSEVRYDSLGALVQEASQLNQQFRQEGVPAKILVFCRTELFERLTNPNKNKIRQDYAIHLEWFDNARSPRDSELVKLANHRAHLSDQRVSDVFSAYFHKDVDGAETIDFLLRHTRHTPRDFLQLLSYVQRFARPNERISRDQLFNGIREYSFNFFLPEIKDELNGYFTQSEIDDAFKLLGAVRKRQFSLQELAVAAESTPRWKALDIRRILDALFDCSAIGNIAHRSGGSTFFSFKHRNRNAVLAPSDDIILHSGLWKAMNLI